MQTAEAFTKIPNALLDDETLTVYERAILIHIARKTIGYGKKSDGISISQFAKATGISTGKIKSTLKELKEQKRIIVKRQSTSRGGNSYSRYSLYPLGHVVTPPGHEVTHPQPRGDPPLGHEVAIQKKIEQKKIDKRGERHHIYDENVFFSLSGSEHDREIHRFLIAASGDKRDPAAYKAKLRKQIEKGHTATLATFEEWYLEDHCKRLTDTHKGKTFGDEIIDGIHSYLNTEGFDHEWKFIVQTHDSNGERSTYTYTTLSEVENALLD